MRDRFHWPRLLAFVTGLVNQELLLRNEYLVAENRILRDQLPARLRLSDAERSALAEIAKRLGRKALAEIAHVAKPDTLLAWYRRLIARSLTDPGIGPIPVALAPLRKSKPWWSASHAKTVAGAMTGSLVPWPISATASPTRP